MGHQWNEATWCEKFFLNIPFIELDIRNRKLVYKTLFKNNAESYSNQCAMQIFETFYIASQEKGKHLRMGYLRVLWLNWEVCWILLWGWFQWNIGFSLQEQMVVYKEESHNFHFLLLQPSTKVRVMILYKSSIPLVLKFSVYTSLT